MKKVIKSKIFLVIITLIIGTSLGVYAANIYKASDIVYNASDGTSMNVNDALNDLYKNKESEIKTKKFETSDVAVSALSPSYSDTSWANPDIEQISCSGSGANQKCTFSDLKSSFHSKIDLQAKKVLGGYVCFNVINPTYEAGIRTSRGWSDKIDSAYIQYLYYKDGICIYLDEATEDGIAQTYATGDIKYRWNNFKKTDTKYGITYENKVIAKATISGDISFTFDVSQIPNYNNNYATVRRGSEYGIMGTQYKMWGSVFYKE